MEPEINRPQPVSNMPAAAKPKSGNKSLVPLLVIISLVLLGGVGYANYSLLQSNKKISNLNTQVSQVSDKAKKLEEVSKKGATDELLGFDKVDIDGYQSVFLSGGQVYFGKITSMTTENIVLEDIYYLRVNGQTQAAANPSSANQDISLVKLGCELHKPEDKMTIIRSNVQFWENLKDKDPNGVVPAITEYKKANPNGQKCS